MSVPKTHADGAAKNRHGQELLDELARQKSAAARIVPDANDARYAAKARSQGNDPNAFDRKSGPRNV